MVKTKITVFGFSLLFLLLSAEAHAARFFLSPASTEFNTGCNSAVNIMIDTEGEYSSAADAFVFYDPSKIEIVDQDSVAPGIQIREGNVFEAYAGNKADNATGKITMTGFSFFNDYRTEGSAGTFATIIFKPKPGAAASDLTFDFTPGSTMDSNISDPDSNEILTSVGNGSYTFVDVGYCGEDTVPPNVTNPKPNPNSRGNPLNSNITFDISDNLSGVDIDTVQVTVDGTTYQKGDAEFTYSGDPSKYAIVINPPDDFLPDTEVFVEVDGADFAGNIMSTYRWSFNRPIPDTDPPYVTGTDPSPGEKNVPLDSNVVFHVRDDESGVDIDTVVVVVDGVTYQKGDSGFGYSGNPGDYFIVIDPASDFSADTAVYVEVDATDLAGNSMNTYRYSFNHPEVDNTPPYVINPSPTPGARQVPFDSDVAFNIRDNLSGVDISTVEVKVDGTDYRNGDPGFSYTGDKMDYRIVIDPTSDFPDQKEIRVEIDGNDFRGNIMPTYIFRFNRPAVCGDYVVELDEECEPPNTSGCDDMCDLVFCEVIEPGEEICGDGIVQGNEQCEPPNTQGCDGTCQFSEEVEPSPLTGYIRITEEEERLITEQTRDYDNDGLPDVMEVIFGTNGESDDSDGDGFTDLEEILDYGTDPNDAASLEIYTRITNWEDGDVTGNTKLFVKGVSHAEKNVKVFARQIATGTRFFLGETETDIENKFAVLSGIELEQGEYLLEAESYEDDGTLIDQANPVRIIIDFGKYLGAPRVEAINDVPVVEDVEVIVYDRQPMVFGSTEPDSQVFVIFESLLFTSTVISDGVSGKFAVFSPRPLEIGDHTVTAYAVDPEGIVSDLVVVDFEVRDTLDFLKGRCWWCWLIILIILAVITYFVRKWYLKRKHEKELEKQKKDIEKRKEIERKLAGKEEPKTQTDLKNGSK